MNKLILYLLKNFSEQSDENRTNIINLLEKLKSHLPTNNQLTTNGKFKDLPYELMFEILLYLDYEDIKKLRGDKDIEYVLSLNSFWKRKLYTEFPAVKKYKYPQFLRYHPNHPAELNKALEKATWKDKYFDFKETLEKALQKVLEVEGHFVVLNIRLIDVGNILLSPDDRSFIYETIKRWRDYSTLNKFFIILNNESRNDQGIVYNFLIHYSRFYKLIGNDLKNNKDFILSVVKKNPFVFSYVSHKFKNDKDIVLATMRKHGALLPYANKRLRDDYNIVMEAIRNNRIIPDPRLGQHLTIMILKYTSKRLRKNYNICLEAVKRNGLELIYCSNDLKNNYNIVMTAVKDIGSSLEYASTGLKNNEDICIEAVKQTEKALVFVDDTLLRSENFRKRLQKVKNIPKNESSLLRMYFIKGPEALINHKIQILMEPLREYVRF